MRILLDVRRKVGALVPLETAICISALELLNEGAGDFHGYAMAKRLSEARGHRMLTAYGTLYRALGRLEAMGLLRSQWEAPDIPARENRPGRRLYALTATGEIAAQEARAAAPEQSGRRVRRRPATA